MTTIIEAQQNRVRISRGVVREFIMPGGYTPIDEVSIERSLFISVPRIYAASATMGTLKCYLQNQSNPIIR